MDLYENFCAMSRHCLHLIYVARQCPLGLFSVFLGVYKVGWTCLDLTHVHIHVVKWGRSSLATCRGSWGQILLTEYIYHYCLLIAKRMEFCDV